MMRILMMALLMTGGYAAGYIAADLQWQADTLKTKLDENEGSRAEEHRQIIAVNRIDHDTQNQLEQARADATTAAAASDRLRKELTATQTRYQSRIAAERQARIRVVLLYYELFRRADERAGELAAYADRTSIKLNACVRTYHEATGQPLSDNRK